MQTTLTKKDKGWVALTILALPGVIERHDYRNSVKGVPDPAELRIETSKSYDGGIDTRASVVYNTGTGFRCAISFAGDGDYSRTIQRDRKARCTEKKVGEFHADSLTYLDTVLADVAAHYKVADPLTAPELEPA